MKRLAILPLLTCLIGAPTALSADPRVALLPLVRNENVTDFQYSQIHDAFYLSLSFLEGVDLMTDFELALLLNQERQTDGPQAFRSEDWVFDFGDRNKLDLIVVGRINSIGSEAGQPIVGLEVELISVPERTIFNRVAWSFDQTQADGPASGQRMADLSAGAAARLLWQGSEFYPVNVIVETSRASRLMSQVAYTKRVRTEIESLQLPRGVEVDTVQLKITEREQTITSGYIGLFTLVGWTFLPYSEVDYTANVVVRVKYVDSNGVGYREFSAQDSSKHKFMLYDDESTISAVSDDTVDELTRNVAQQIRSDEQVTRLGQENLERFMRSRESD